MNEPDGLHGVEARVPDEPSCQESLQEPADGMGKHRMNGEAANMARRTPVRLLQRRSLS